MTTTHIAAAQAYIPVLCASLHDVLSAGSATPYMAICSTEVVKSGLQGHGAASAGDLPRLYSKGLMNCWLEREDEPYNFHSHGSSIVSIITTHCLSQVLAAQR